MSRKSRIVSPTEEVVADVNKHGLKAVATKHGIDSSNLWRWLKAQGFVRKSQYVKENQSSQKFQLR